MEPEALLAEDDSFAIEARLQEGVAVSLSYVTHIHRRKHDLWNPWKGVVHEFSKGAYCTALVGNQRWAYTEARVNSYYFWYALIFVALSLVLPNAKLLQNFTF